MNSRKGRDRNVRKCSLANNKVHPKNEIVDKAEANRSFARGDNERLIGHTSG